VVPPLLFQANSHLSLYSQYSLFIACAPQAMAAKTAISVGESGVQMVESSIWHFGSVRRAIIAPGVNPRSRWGPRRRIASYMDRINTTSGLRFPHKMSWLNRAKYRLTLFFCRALIRNWIGEIKGHLFLLVYHALVRHRATLKPIAVRLSERFDREMAAGGRGDGLFLLAHRFICRGWEQPTRLTLFLIYIGIVGAMHSHRAASQYSRMLKTARIFNLLFRPYIRARHDHTASLYFRILYQMSMFERIAREFPEPEELDNCGLAVSVGVAHLYLKNSELAKHFFKVAKALDGNNHLVHRMLGCAHLVEGDYDAASNDFDKSVKMRPSTVMAHQNFAGRYEVSSYKPKRWELASAGKLLVYDNLMQLAENYFLQGRFYESFHNYQLALRFQSRLAEMTEMPKRLRRLIRDKCTGFDSSLPIRILPYEWVTQFGHIGLLDSYTKMAALGTIPKANYVLLAPRGKVSNPEYLAYWERYFCIVRDEKLVDMVFPYQRIFGDQFMALPSDGELAEPWTRAAARAQIEWAKTKHGPLLKLKTSHKRQGEKILRKFGLPPDAWYVGLHVREGGFYGDGTGTISEHRSANVNDYFGAIEEVTSSGGWVVRLGDTSMTPLPAMPNVIDYVHSGEKSALMDLFLLATSRFVIGTTSGLSTVAMSFGTPMLLVNCISNDWQIWTEDTDFIVKQVYNKCEHRYLSLTETYRQPFQAQLINHSLLRRRGFAVHSNTASEIRAATRYKLATMLSIAPRASEDHPLMQRYRRALSENPFMFGAARPALPFLDAHPELLDPPSECVAARAEKHSAA
jgi:putative glycosyltransferase (TIGR04372 family)